MEPILSVSVPGDPIPKGRPRATRTGQFYTPPRTREAETFLRMALQKAYGWQPPHPGPVGIDVVFYCATMRRVDGDNLLKLVTDAMQRGRRPDGGVILDDDQINEWKCRIHRKVFGQQPRTEITVYPLDDAPTGPPQAQ